MIKLLLSLINFKNITKNNKIDVLLAPINFYVDMVTNWYKKDPDYKVNLTTGEIFIVKTKQNIFWSNKYIPFNDFVFVDKRFFEMIF
jgi:hypothetical protein